jgi:aminoacyl tRNA synthase complex-interacting multifunctional protein 1
VTFDLDNAPAQERKAEPPKKKEKKPVTEVVKEKVSGVKDAVKEKVAAVSKKEKKGADNKLAAGASEEGGKKKKGESQPKQAAAEDVGDPQPSMIDLRVGKIVEISRHPDADSLYVEVSLGTSCRRTLTKHRTTRKLTLARKAAYEPSSPAS